MSVAYANLLDAMLGHMRGSPGLVAAFGDTGTAAPATDKFWPSPVRTGVTLPWAVYEDGGGNTGYTTGRATIEEGAIRFVVAADGKDTANRLAKLLVKTLNDAPLTFMDGLLMHFRASAPPSVVPISSILPDCPNGYAYGVTFSTMVQGTA